MTELPAPYFSKSGIKRIVNIEMEPPSIRIIYNDNSWVLIKIHDLEDILSNLLPDNHNTNILETGIF